MSGETVFLNDGSAYVSNSRIVLGGTTYATSNITSVNKSWTPPSTGCPVLLVILGALIVLPALVVFLVSLEAGIGAFFGGLVLLFLSAGVVALGVLWYRSLKPVYHVVLTSAAGEQRGLTGDETVVDRIVAAISEAITFRG